MLFHVYDDPKPDDYYLFEPQGTYRALLDADWLLYVLLPALLIVIVIALMVAWRMHEIPKHRAEKKKMRQAELVSALTVMGIFEHWVWVIALFFAYVDWDAFEDSVVNILRRSRLREDVPATAVAVAVVAAAETVEVVTTETVVVETAEVVLDEPPPPDVVVEPTAPIAPETKA